MNCWKTIDLSKDYGFQRLFLYFIFASITAFIALYLPLSMVDARQKLDAGHIFYFLLILILILPVHKLLHALPLILCGNVPKMKMEYAAMIPIIRLKPCVKLSKQVMLATLLLPFFILTAACIQASLIMPEYVHYFCLAAALHIGWCVPDLIYARQVMAAPRTCMVEEDRNALEILIEK
ncbi:DUF3267 domain-containing protein [Bacillus sp. FJAT-42376]|uniref:DUF3267 domain-containing protein n=1 Tax=Bacillus sp. FJAT-42376 TaxID=2014076 RepID=UPI000F5013B7|nr:DUF3267 domain-containing protein [Bacillus sp. FJAT-42376]AZB42236.1 DUF3267 domain-containing protein [Bacillus sp. FJAT-42376]